MISVADAFSVEEADSVRKIATSAQFAWKKDFQASIRFFAIGVSTIGGNDLIAGASAPQTTWNKYVYTDESAYLLAMEYERELNMPVGGLSMALADLRLDNTSGRFTPRHMGGNSEIFTALIPGRPVVLNAGFHYDGVDNTVPQFVGLTHGTPKTDTRSKETSIKMFDFMDYIQNAYVDKTAMFTAETTDFLLEQSLQALGFSTSQYDLDPGINIVPFTLFPTGTRWGEYVDKLVQSENGHMYQDEFGVIHFENREHWASYPYTDVQRIISTSQVINAEIPSDDHIINVVEVKASPREVQSSQLIWQASGYAGSGTLTLSPGDTEVWVNYNDPIFEVDTPVGNGVVGQTSFFVANSASDGLGIDKTSSVTLKSITNFAQTSKLVFTNNSANDVFLTTLDIWGRPARKTGDIYYKGKVDSSITAFGEQPLVIENDYIQNSSWAASLAELILRDFAQPENLQNITIRAIPELQMGDLISWQGRHWRVFGIRTSIYPSVGFIQELRLLQRTITTYFRIGISTIGGSDQIAP